MRTVPRAIVTVALILGVTSQAWGMLARRFRLWEGFMGKAILGALLVIGMVAFAGQATALTDAQKCEATKLKRAGQYNFCRAKADGKAVKTGDPVDYSKCDAKLTGKWADAESIPMCPTTGDVTDIQDQVAADADFIALKLAGVRFVDNGDGTVTDTQTGLMWEKKDDGGGLHDKDNTYTWADAMSEFISEVNGYGAGGGVQTGGLGGHSDWRMPTYVELTTILLQPFPCGTMPCIDSIFGATATDSYWSSTTSSANTSNAYDSSFFNGGLGNQQKTNTFYARAVRNAP